MAARVPLYGTARTAAGPHHTLRPPMTRPRPGHADLAGGLKYDLPDFRNILEWASARETAIRVAAGSVCRRLLCEFIIRIISIPSPSPAGSFSSLDSGTPLGY